MKAVLTYVRRTALHPSGASDGQLLEAFVARRDDAAFMALVRRHGAMVLSVARRVLGHVQDAEDTFQATFLVLAKRAASIQRRELLGNWLYGVAYRTALEARRLASRRRASEMQVSVMPEPAVCPPEAGRELPALVDQELARLPDKYRIPIVLCDLEGRSRKDVARRLGIPEGTLSSRLATARQRLARRLTQRGVTLSAGAVAVALTQSAAAAAPCAALVGSTVRAAVLVSAGAPCAGAVSTKALALLNGVVHAMFLTKLKNAALVVVAICLLGVGLSMRPQGPATSGAAERPAAAQDKKTPPAKAADELQGAWKVLSVIADGEKVKPEETPSARLYFHDGNGYMFQDSRFRDDVRYEIDATRTPKTIDLTDRHGDVTKGIFMRQGEKLTLCFAKDPDANRPGKFESTAESKSVLMVLQLDPKAPKLDLTKIEAEKQARENRNGSATNLKKLGLAMHNHHDDKGELPAAAICDGDGKPLLSWRVALLPYLGENDLYNEFKLNEAWDSAHNKKLLAKMPAIYGDDGDKTFYQVFTGEGTLFDGNKAAKLSDVTDGLANTILFVEAGEAVPWTKPADLRYTAGKPLPKLGGLFKDGFHVTTGDGAVRFVAGKFKTKVLEALITIAGGETDTLNDLEDREADGKEKTRPSTPPDAKRLMPGRRAGRI